MHWKNSLFNVSLQTWLDFNARAPLLYIAGSSKDWDENWGYLLGCV